MRQRRRSTIFIGITAALCLAGTLGGTAFASPASGVKGDPQPELKPFKLGNLGASSPGSLAMEPDGAMVAVYDIATGNGRALVCVLDRGKNACSSKDALSPLGGDTAFGTPQVFVPSANHVVVLQEACCNDPASGGDVLFTSTDGGKAFGTPVRVGALGVTAAALVGRQVVFTEGFDTGGVQVESISLASPSAPSPTLVNSKKAFDVGVGSYHGGALIAFDNQGASFATTYVEYASAGHNFNSSGSYRKVGAFGKEKLLGISGDALLTIQTDGHTTVELRLFNGRTFGPPHPVPGTSGGGGPEWFTVDQDPSGAVHVFGSRAAWSPTYELKEYSTTSGTHWTGPLNLGDATSDEQGTAALDSHGAGLVLGTPEPLAYPVLAPQSVSFKLQPTSIRKGKSATGSGQVTPKGGGRLVTLQVERSGKWYDVATTHEKSNGSFSFTIKGKSAGTFSYRAVVSDLAGYLLYGYSNARSLRVS